MGPSWAKMASGSELDVIFGQMRTKMEAKFDLEAVLRRLEAIFNRLEAILRRKRAIKAKNNFWNLENIAGTGGCRNLFG